MAYNTFRRVFRYTLVRAVTLFIVVVISVILVILIANLGGYLDTIQEALIDEDITFKLMGGWMRDATPEERQLAVNQTRWAMQEEAGLHQPFLSRCARWFYRGITLDWGNARYSYLLFKERSGKEIYSQDISELVAAFLPRTLLLIGITNLVLFLVSVAIALRVARKPNSWIDKSIIALAPTASAPSWVYAMLLYAIFFRVLKVFSFSLDFNQWQPMLSLAYLPILFKGLFLPFLVILMSKFFQSVYIWRTYFLHYSREPYIELAKAKGLPNNVFEKNYILRPALPGLITYFALIMIMIWQECIALEFFFRISGIGWLFVRALYIFDIPVIVALVVMFAYLLAITVFILDIVYALVDPRVKIGEDNRRGMSKKARPRLIDPYKILTVKKPISLKLNLKKPSRSWFPRVSISALISALRQSAAGLGRFSGEMAHYPSAVLGFILIAFFAFLSIYTVTTIPYSEAERRWRGDDKAFFRNPVNVPPAWTNWFRKEMLPENIDLNSSVDKALKATTTVGKESQQIQITFPFDFNYRSTPQDVALLFSPRYKLTKPFVSLKWRTPDGREIPLKNFAISTDMIYRLSQDEDLLHKLQNISPEKGLFLKPGAQPPQVVQGRYELSLTGYTFEKDADLDVELIVYGQVFGLAGTDNLRRDLSLGLFWGSAVALSFGILAAFVTLFSSVTIAAAGAWFGGWLDGIIQRITELNMVLPVLPICLMIFILYSKSFWVILGVTIALSIFGNSIKNYRAVFLQLKETSYIEAARAYGATNGRIIFHYMIPYVRSMMIPQFIILVPSYVFYEATLAFLGVSDPMLPTLGKMLASILGKDIIFNSLHLILEPLIVLMLIGLGFSLLGFSLERFYQDKQGI